MRRPFAQVPRGASITGTVRQVTDQYIYVDIGASINGRLPTTPETTDPHATQVGQRLPVEVAEVEMKVEEQTDEEGAKDEGGGRRQAASMHS